MISPLNILSIAPSSVRSISDAPLTQNIPVVPAPLSEAITISKKNPSSGGFILERDAMKELPRPKAGNHEPEFLQSPCLFLSVCNMLILDIFHVY